MEKEGVVVKGRAIIDTRPPFRSVKEAVALFGERVLVGEIYAKQLQEIQTDSKPSKEHVTTTLGTVSEELEETKQNLEKAREEGNYMENCLKSLRQELEQTKRELRQLKAAKEVMIIEHPKATINLEIEELKFVEINHQHRQQQGQQYELEKKKFVSFASPPSLTREIRHDSQLGRTPSFRKEQGNKKKNVINPVVGWLFPWKKKAYQGAGEVDRSPIA